MFKLNNKGLIARKALKSISTLLSIMLMTISLVTPAYADTVQLPIVIDTFNSSNVSNATGNGGTTLLWSGGTTSTPSNILRLAPNTNNQAGYAVRRNQIKLTGGFSTYFVMNLNNTTNTPADGLCFVVQSNPTPVIGCYGAGLGFGGGPNDSTGKKYPGVTNSLGLEFDIYQNGGLDSSTNNTYYDPIPLTSIGAITQSSSTLKVGALSPSGATASYQWQEATSSTGTYTNISGATGTTYNTVSGDTGNYIEVVATGTATSTGSYTETTTSAPILIKSSGKYTQQQSNTQPSQQYGYVAIVKNGDNTHNLANKDAMDTNPGAIYGSAVNVWVDYDGSTLTATYGPSITRNSSSNRTISENVGTYLANQNVYVGFSGSTGACTANIDIDKWYFSDSYVTGGVGSTPGTYTQGANSVGITLTPGSNNPTTANFVIQDVSNTILVNQSVAVYMDSSTTPVSGSPFNTGQSGYSYTIPNLPLGSHTITGVAIYDGGASNTANFTVTTPLTGIGAIIGADQVGSVLTAGALAPTGGTATYQWQESTTSGGTYTNIANATLNTYTPNASDLNKFIEVVATGTGNYTGTVKSTSIQVGHIPLTSIGAITGNPQVGSVLTAGSIVPSGASATYQWQSASSSGGTYTNISGATGTTYNPVTVDAGKFIEVTAAGTGSYTGTVKSAPTTAVTIPLTSMGAIIGTPQVGSVLTAGATVPSGATVNYQWQSVTSGGVYTNISGATSSTYIPVTADTGKLIEVIATGTTNYTGVVTSAPTTAVTIPLTSIGVITGTPQVGSVLTAGVLSPAGGTATYQWQEAISGGNYTVILGATGTTYTPVTGDVGNLIEVVATGTSNYTGTLTSTPTTAVTIPLTSIGVITGTPQVGSVLTAGVLTPEGGTATYQWQSATSATGSFTNIPGANNATYTSVTGDVNKFIEVIATGTGNYTGIITSNSIQVVDLTPTKLILNPEITSLGGTSNMATLEGIPICTLVKIGLARPASYIKVDVSDTVSNPTSEAFSNLTCDNQPISFVSDSSDPEKLIPSSPNTSFPIGTYTLNDAVTLSGSTISEGQTFQLSLTSNTSAQDATNKDFIDTVNTEPSLTVSMGEAPSLH